MCIDLHWWIRAAMTVGPPYPSVDSESAGGSLCALRLFILRTIQLHSGPTMAISFSRGDCRCARVVKIQSSISHNGEHFGLFSSGMRLWVGSRARAEAYLLQDRIGYGFRISLLDSRGWFLGRVGPLQATGVLR